MVLMQHQRTVSGRLRYTIEDRGYESPCWIWAMKCRVGTDRYGYYGREGYKGRMTLAHRAMYDRVKGPIPSGLDLDHLCRVTLCVNPDHLEAVPTIVNCRRGIRTTLSESERREIVALLASGWRGTDIAHAYGVSKSQVSRMRKGLGVALEAA